MQNKIYQATFLASASCLKDCVQSCVVEIVCLGRSNVGKSSFINFFLHKKGLAKSSSTPGKTRLINFYEAIYQEQDKKIVFRIIDLPGFGYAKVSKEQKKIWESHLVEFLQKRHSIKLFLHLIDCRHLDLKIDQEVSEFLKHLVRGDQKILEIYTKGDKLNHQQKSQLLSTKRCLVSHIANESKVMSLQSLQTEVMNLALGLK